jgi:hypothetical protein
LFFRVFPLYGFLLLSLQLSHVVIDFLLESLLLLLHDLLVIEALAHHDLVHLSLFIVELSH